MKLREERRRQNVVPNQTLFVVNFDPMNTDERHFEEFFSRYGVLSRVQIKKNFAFVEVRALRSACLPCPRAAHACAVLDLARAIPRRAKCLNLPPGPRLRLTLAQANS